MQPETNYDPKDWPETDICVYPVPEVQTQAAELIEEGENCMHRPLRPHRPDPTELEYVPVLGEAVKLPPYYHTLQDGTIVPLTRSEYKKGMLKEFTVKHRSLPCGHKLVADQNGPSHRNCQICWFSFFQVFGQETQAVEEAYKVNPLIVKQLRGDTFLKMFLRFMSTVATMKETLETQTADG